MSLETIPASIKQLSRLGTLDIAGCKSLQSLPELPQNLLQLKASGCMSLETIPASIKQLYRLGTLNIEGCKSLQSLPELPQNLLRIEASGCMSLETIPASIKQLSRLETLDIAGCKSLQSLPELPQNLLRLEASGCTSLETIYAGIKQLSRLETLDIAGCKSLKSIQELPQNLLRLKASGCTSLETISAAFTRLVFGSRNSSQQCVFDFDEKECGDTVCDLHTNFITNGHRYKAFGATPQVSIIYTGSKVPGYINHQSIGDSINFEFSSNWLNNGFLGFALGFVYKPGSIAECRHHCFHYVLFIGDKCMSDSGLGSSIGSLIPNDTEAEHVFVKFDHELRDMILRNACKSQSCHDVFLLKFRSECCCKIKMCGVIPLYAQGQGHNTLQLLPLGGHAKAALENKRCQEDKPPSMSQFDADEPGQNHGSREMDEGLPRPKKLELFQHVTASTLAEWGSMLSL